jgi:GT2 family glycosyltransferase
MIPKVYIIILNWNGINDTFECLNSVFKLNYKNFEVIVVDNGSTDDSVDTINQKFPKVILIENHKNLGFTGGNNVGMKLALELGADYVWLLNNDTVVESDSLFKLVDVAEKDPYVGLLSPAVHDYDIPNNIQFIGCHINYNNYSLIPVKEPKELETVDQSNLVLYGTALLVKKIVITTIGFLSDKYFAYVEDCDYSVRALKANFRTMVKPDARVYHKGVQSTGKYSPPHVYLGTRNLYYFWKDNSTGLKRFLLPAFYIGMVINYSKELSDEGNENGFKACINGLWAASKGEGGGYNANITAPSWIHKLFRFFVTWHPYFWVMLIRFNFRDIARTALSRVKSSIFNF